MADPLAPWLLIGLTLTELLLLVAVVVFFRRLKRSEHLLEQLQQKQEQFVAKLAFSTELEQELVSSFQERQQELLKLEKRLVQRRDELESLLKKTETKAKPQQMARSPKQIVLNGFRRGLSAKALAQASGLSLDEVELILIEARRTNKG